MTKKIVAIGGGENGRLNSDGNKYPYETCPMDQDIVRSTDKQHPNFLFLGHESTGAQKAYSKTIEAIYNGMYDCDCKILHSDVLNHKDKAQALIDWADIIYEGGEYHLATIEQSNNFIQKKQTLKFAFITVYLTDP